MKILLDENLPRKLAALLPGHQCSTVVECGWSGKKNGELLELENSAFDILLTLDKNLPYQQDLNSGRIAVLVIRAWSNRIQDLVPVAPECLSALDRIRPRQAIRVGALLDR
ncbi:MAG: hypothetical protein C0504_09760 [Candidatus Solibacter sp.]|nr:hypothetical protein [Candidatus Solibacter sp.]